MSLLSSFKEKTLLNWDVKPTNRAHPISTFLGKLPSIYCMTYVYILRSIRKPDQLYVGNTVDVRARLASHNHGKSPHTSRFRPWQLVYYEKYEAREEALKREKQFKRWSGTKKRAIISGELAVLKKLSRCKNRWLFFMRAHSTRRRSGLPRASRRGRSSR